MVLLNIFNLDDVHNEHVVASLSNGSHVIGRGDLLNITTRTIQNGCVNVRIAVEERRLGPQNQGIHKCPVRDKRVSRKHALINVSEDNITLTSAHVNPCFFQAAQGKNLTILNKDHTNELGDGDRFGLLPDSLWFRVKINRRLDIDEVAHSEQRIEDQINVDGGSNNFADVTTNNTENISLKRHIIEENHENANKRNRLSDAGASTSTSILTGNIVSGRDKTTASQHSESELNLQLDGGDVFNEGNDVNNEHLSRENIGQIGDNEPGALRSPNFSTQLNTSADLNETAVVEDASNTSLAGGAANDVEIEADNIKQEKLSDSNSQGLTTHDNEVKTEPKSGSEAEQGSSSSCNQGIKVDPQTSDQSSTDNVASGSGTKKTRRERCWYAEKCFRKNPHHRETFSHPGDQDYDSDPEDDRPACPYGPMCYRRNIEHRQEYKHINRPAPKPTTTTNALTPGNNVASGSNDDDGSDNDNTQDDTEPSQDTQEAKKRRREKAAKRKNLHETPPDDYDYDDPFICNDSSDEFQYDDDGGDSDDSEWDDSQVVEEDRKEQKRLLREAKKFRKGK